MSINNFMGQHDEQQERRMNVEVGRILEEEEEEEEDDPEGGVRSVIRAGRLKVAFNIKII